MVFLKRFKKFLFFICGIFISLAVLTAYSLYQEEEHRKRCHELGIKCNPGTLRSVVDYLEVKISELLKQNEKPNSAPKIAPQPKSNLAPKVAPKLKPKIAPQPMKPSTNGSK